MQPRAAQIDGNAEEFPVGPGAPADSIASFEHDARTAAIPELMRGRQARSAGAYDDDLDRGIQRDQGAARAAFSSRDAAASPRYPLIARRVR